MALMDIPQQGNIDQAYFSIIADLERPPMLQAFIGRRPSLRERLAMGKELRKKLPRSSHAGWRVPPGRTIRSRSWRRRMPRASRSWCRCATPA